MSDPRWAGTGVDDEFAHALWTRSTLNFPVGAPGLTLCGEIARRTYSRWDQALSLGRVRCPSCVELDQAPMPPRGRPVGALARSAAIAAGLVPTLQDQLFDLFATVCACERRWPEGE